MSKAQWYVPETPGGTILFDLKARSEKVAWKNLMKGASHMPYRTQQDFANRGYKVKPHSFESVA